jgi:tripeptidyl-peptidase-1
LQTDSEVAVTRFGSGGGFSNIYPVPYYYSKSVNGYLINLKPPYTSYSATYDQGISAGGGIYNRNGRGYPDVGAVGDNLVIFNRGMPVLIGGASASAPVWASLTNRINEERLAAGKSAVGLVNPALYTNPGVMDDITTGNNPGCNLNRFSASTGWDPVTGLGNPNYPALLTLFMSL